jgi:aromatic-L-amino-acid decarboxylase
MADLPLSDLDAAGARVLAWIHDYLAHPERYPVLSPVAPGDVRRALPARPPQGGEPLDAILDDFERVVLPGITHWNHPSYFAYFSISSSIPGILGETLAAALDVNGMLWRTSPAATELEQVVLDWLRGMIGMGDDAAWFGLLTDTASISTMLALAAAREARPELDVRERGLAGRTDLPTLRVYCSEHAHSSVDKGAITLGLGHANVVKIPADAEFRMRPDLLRAAMDADVALGHLPVAVVATVGTTSTTSVDPVREVAAIAHAHGAWLHVDASYAGVAGIVPELRWAMDGVDLADSVVVNPHKWLFTPVDCSALWTRHPQVLKRAFALVPEYLTTRDAADGDEPVNLMDYGVQLGRRFRALKLWMVIRAFGVDGLAERIRAHCALAREFAGLVEGEPQWETCAPVPFSLVCFRHVPPAMAGDEAAIARHNARIMDAVNATGRAFLSHTKLGPRYVLRLAIGNIRTERAHVEEAWRLLREAARAADAPALATAAR